MTTQRFTKPLASPVQLWQVENGQLCWSCFHDFRVDFTTTGPSILDLRGRINLHHRGIINGVVGWGVRATLRKANTFAEMPVIPSSSVNLPYWLANKDNYIPGSKCAGNLLSETQHYDTANINTIVELPVAGCYRLEFWGNAHSSLAPTTNGLIDVNCSGNIYDRLDPYSILYVTITE